ncbi:hypothetical protein EC973_009500 [Apophysomyces ossiformis]|uniref:RNB domain-containing protein n=1 Tax=Apophysomyces ossiformis TaxID=679940 RepID=A0A8H7ENE6_9FUNG|nr:hypothetical protein EC973_009500 [Apophysomyces ossiformis]
MDHDLETLEHQTAPESTRGLFDPLEQKPSSMRNSTPADKRRSFHTFGPGLETSRPRQQQPQRGHQRSRSAITSDMLSNHSGRRTLGLQTLAEEEDPKKKREEAGRSVTVDSLQDIINTLRSLPPITTKEESVNNRKSVGHRKQHSMSALNFGPHQGKRLSYNGDMQMVLQNTVQEIRSINDKAERRRSVRAGSISERDEDEYISREAARAEAEAKLMGTYKKEESEDSSIQEKTARRHSTSKHFSYEEPRASDFVRPPGRRFSESSGSFDSSPPNTNKRMSLQLPTLSENSEESTTGGKSGRRIQFNKPLNLSVDEKKTHSRRSSRNFDYDWRSSTSSPAAPPYSPRSSRSSFNLLVPFTPTRVNFARDDANPHQRRPLFIAHLPFSALTPLFRSRQLVRGMLRVNKRNRSDAYVSCEDLDADIYVCGSRDRNRALEGDVVAIRLVDVEKVLREKKEKEEAKLARNGGQVRVRQPDEEDENEIIFGGDEDVDTVKPKYCGVVVAILERAQNQVFSGTLTLMRPNNKRAQEEKAAEEAGHELKKEAPRIVWFKATDKRVPLIAIPIEQAPVDFVENSEEYINRLFVGSIKRWPITSLHPFGTLERELGTITDLNVQTMAILADNNITDTEFSDQVMKCLPSIPFEFNEIPDETRRDLRDIRTFTIDLVGSNTFVVLDDALSIQKLGEDTFEVGVHISDVAYFIKAHSPLDKEARARAVHVDIIHKSVPMLPTELTEGVTNLVPHEPRLTFSVVWKLNSSGKILDTWFGKTVIKSSARLTYDDAQKVLDGKALDTVPDQILRAGLEQDIRMLYGIAEQLYEARFDNGAMSQMRDELDFTFEDLNPTSVFIHRELPATKVVKEFLRLANMSVAQMISSNFPDQALLRRHAPPSDRKIRELQNYATRYLGVNLDISSAGAIERSVELIQDPKIRKVLSVIVLKTLQPPKYFCTGTLDILKYSHYALNVPLFTHFTAPSRRFADIIVHRQLEAALTGDKRFYLDRDTVQKLAQHSNVKKEAAIYACEQSRTLFLSLHLNKLAKQTTKNVVYREALVVAVFDQFFDVMVPEFNLEKRIHLANLPVWRSEFNEKKRALTMFWKKGVDTSTGKQQQWSLSDEEYEDEMDEEALLEEMQEISEEEDTANEKERTGSAIDTNTEKIHGISAQHDVQNRSSFSQPDMTATVTPTASVSMGRRPEASKSTSKRASIIRARLSDSTAYSADQGSQTIQALDKIRVILTIEMVRTPPLIRILAVNPYA